MTRATLPAALLGLLLLGRAGDAPAYIDPGTGSLIVQGLIAGLAAAAMVIRGYWYRIKGFFRRKPAAPSPVDAAERDALPRQRDAQTKQPGDAE